MGKPAPEFRVLIADDDDGIRLLIAEELREAGYQVFTAADGAEAVEILEREPVQLLITDYGMPRMNGLDLIRWSRAHLPHLPAVLITGYEPEALAPGGWGGGALSILLKPFAVERLLVLVGKMCRAPLPA